ncbi:glycosyltransferase family 4 protein [Thalassospira xiamenensis]|nr:glycosyltransferase family 4 protein [Thalassospira xiamenensis]
MRILITSPTFPPINSGLGNAVLRQAQAISDAGHDVIVATGSDKRETYQISENIKIEYFPVKGSNYFIDHIQGDTKCYVDFLSQYSWDIILMNAWQNWATDIALNHLDHISGKKIVYSHGISTNNFFLNRPVRSLVRYLAWRPYWWRLKAVMKKLDAIFFLAQSGTDCRFDDLRLAEKNEIPYYIVPNCLSKAAVDARNSDYLKKHEREIFIAVGSYEWQKGFDFVLKAYARSSACNKVTLHFFGQKKTHFHKILVELSKKLGINSNYVVFHENISGDELLEQYKRSRLILLGSHTECQPLVLIDATATGTPFIARSTGCISEMKGGISVKRWQDMSEKINLLDKNDVMWENLSNKGIRSSHREYSPDNVSRELIKSIETVYKNEHKHEKSPS